MNTMNAEQLAKLFHETYEQLAPAYGYTTRPETAIPWEQISPDQPNKQLMIAVAAEVLRHLQSIELLSLYTALTLYPRVVAINPNEDRVMVERFIVRVSGTITLFDACAFAFIVIRSDEVRDSIMCTSWSDLQQTILDYGKGNLLQNRRWTKGEA